MKKIITIAILFFFCWQFVGSYLYFENAQRKIRAKAKVMINCNKTNFKTLKLTSKEYKEIVWITKKEFRLDLELYDVRSIHKKRSIYEIVCILDKDESQLIHKYSNYIQTNLTHKNRNNSSLVWNKVLNSIYLLSVFESMNFSQFEKETNSKIGIFHIENQSSPHLKSIFNPPIFSVSYFF